VPTATAAAAAAAAAASGTIVPLRTRIIQLIAQHPRGAEEKELMRMLKVGLEDLQSILSSVSLLLSLSVADLRKSMRQA
jgi:hypothetical protein